MTFRTFCSMNGFGLPNLIDAAVLNALRFVHCHLLVLHISRGAWAFNTTLTRAGVVVNPKQYEYRRHGPNVFNAHLSNLDIILRRTLDEKDDAKVVVLPGQAVFTHDCAPYLRAHDLSMPVILEYDLKHSQHYGWFRDVFQYLMHYAGDGSMLARPIAIMPHEGSFYALKVVREMLGVALQTNLRKNCPFFVCTLEELVFPSLVAQRVNYNGTYARIGDPLVTRVFNWSMNVKAFLATPLATCGRKLVHDIGETVNLRALQRVKLDIRSKIQT